MLFGERLISKGREPVSSRTTKDVKQQRSHYTMLQGPEIHTRLLTRFASLGYLKAEDATVEQIREHDISVWTKTHAKLLGRRRRQ